ncbi:hypothetical protein GF406_26385 [candidate division KSB1 bacterium]|nr:hypothetical protein [candidate division KSB1 bacterium]
MKDPHVIRTIGILALVAGILLSRYAPPVSVVDFFEGFFYGLSIIFNLYSLFQYRKIRKSS